MQKEILKIMPISAAHSSRDRRKSFTQKKIIFKLTMSYRLTYVYTEKDSAHNSHSYL